MQQSCPISQQTKHALWNFTFVTGSGHLKKNSVSQHGYKFEMIYKIHRVVMANNDLPIFSPIYRNLNFQTPEVRNLARESHIAHKAIIQLVFLFFKGEEKSQLCSPPPPKKKCHSKGKTIFSKNFTSTTTIIAASMLLFKMCMANQTLQQPMAAPHHYYNICTIYNDLKIHKLT